MCLGYRDCATASIRTFWPLVPSLGDPLRLDHQWCQRWRKPRPVEGVTLQIGSRTIPIPSGSFVAGGITDYSAFVGVINGVSLSVSLLKLGGNNYAFGVIAKNVSLTVSNPPAPITVTLTIGGDSGTTTVSPVIINTGP